MTFRGVRYTTPKFSVVAATARINPALESRLNLFSDRDATIAADFDNEDEEDDERVCAHFPSRREANAYRLRRSLKGTITAPANSLSQIPVANRCQQFAPAW